MGAIEDTRKVLQDLVSPALKAIEARLVALEKNVDLRFKHVDDKLVALDQKMDTKFSALEQKMDLKFDVVAAVAAANHSAVMHALDLDRRLETLESQRNPGKLLDRPA